MIHAFVVLCSVFLVSSVPGLASVIDQSVTAPAGEGANINECCAFIGQTYTAGITGTLAGVSVDIMRFASNNYPLDVQIRTVTGGLPATSILGEAVTNQFSLTDIITFSQVVPQIAGTQYAIVVHFVGAPPEGANQAVGVWSGVPGNPYPGGLLVASYDYGVTFPLSYPDFDQRFVTYVNTATPEPAAFLLVCAGLSAVVARRAISKGSSVPC